ncbi:MAG TPA: hypothetical protein VHX39_21175, partial [Acetobacteraceae bacterium]|nr:hypothetical protein [Acetobacteraceae bacterium]
LAGRHGTHFVATLTVAASAHPFFGPQDVAWCLPSEHASDIRHRTAQPGFRYARDRGRIAR